LIQIKEIKIIFINRSCFLHWIYYKQPYFLKHLYKIYQKAKYIISLIPFENDYLFRKWGINSILMNNFIPYNFNSIVPSDLSSKRILMIGRGDDKIKRLDLGIEAMKYIIKDIPESEMLIISNLKGTNYLQEMVQQLNLKKVIKFVGYHSNPEQFYRNASLHIFPTLAEAFPNVLSETLVYGIPNILVGLDYVSAAKGGTVIIYDDSPLSIAKIAIKILRNKRLRKKLGKEARKNIKKYRNNLLFNKWIKLILSIYKGDDYYKKLQKEDIKISKNDALKIISNQIYLLKKRENKFRNITIKDIENFTYIENIK
jgi:glycosyltransferase involved in cell wall biosynthesis